MNKMRSKDSKGFSGRNRKFKRFFRPKTGDFQKKKVFSKFARAFPADIGNSSGFSGRKQVISKTKTKKRSYPNLQEIFRPISEIQAVFPAEIRWSPKKKQKRSSSQKRHEIRCQSTKNTNLGLDLHSSSPEPVNFSGAQSLLGGAQFSFGGNKQSFGGHGPGMPPRGAGSVCCFCKPRFFPTRKKMCACFQRQGT